MEGVFRNKFLLTSIFMFLVANLCFVFLMYFSASSDLKRQVQTYNTIKSTEHMARLQDADLMSKFVIVDKRETLLYFFGMDVQEDFGILTTIDGRMVKFYSSKHDINTIKTMYLFFIVLYVIGSILVLYSASSKKMCKLFRKTNNDTKMNEKTLSLLSENIHHELKTPLVVISSKLEQLQDVFETLTKEAMCMRRRKMDKLLLDSEGCINGHIDECKSMKDFELLKTHVGVIYNILDRMKDFKNMKRAEADRTLYDVIDVSFKTLKMFSKNDFNYKIDILLKKFSVDNIGNEDIINIFINHIKNSLEANATEVDVFFIEYKDGIVSTQIMDNGNGIPSDIQSKVFNTNFSTKEYSDGEARGVGLYLSKHTINTFGGDVFLIESDSRGTSFGIDIPSKRR